MRPKSYFVIRVVKGYALKIDEITGSLVVPADGSYTQYPTQAAAEKSLTKALKVEGEANRPLYLIQKIDIME